MGGPQSVLAAETQVPPMSAASRESLAAENKGVFALGVRVRLVHLQARIELNGVLAVIVAQRGPLWQVLLANGRGMKLVREANLIRCDRRQFDAALGLDQPQRQPPTAAGATLPGQVLLPALMAAGLALAGTGGVPFQALPFNGHMD